MAGLTSILNVLVPVQEKEGYEAKVSACSFLLLSGPGAQIPRPGACIQALVTRSSLGSAYPLPRNTV